MLKSSTNLVLLEPLHRFSFVVLKQRVWLLSASIVIGLLILESSMIACVPTGLLAETLDDQRPYAMGVAALVGVPTYVNRYAALPLVSGLMDQGMNEGAAMSFLLAGGVSSITAAIAVWALVRPPTFLFYLAAALTGSFAAGLACKAWRI